MKELKVNLDIGNWVGFVAPKGVPEEIIAKLDRAIEKALKSPEVIKAWREMGNMTTYQDHKTFAQWLGPHDTETRDLVDSMGLWVAPH
jgi:tripartite-type tricarboxylate transporter receptor subunit TctC